LDDFNKKEKKKFFQLTKKSFAPSRDPGGGPTASPASEAGTRPHRPKEGTRGYC